MYPYKGLSLIDVLLNNIFITMELPVPIHTPRLYLRPPQPEDAELVYAAIVESHKELATFMPWATPQPSLEDTVIFIEQSMTNWILQRCEEPFLPLFIFDKEGVFLGSTGFHHYDWIIPCLECGYWLRTPYTGQGYMTEAILGLTYYAFQQLKLKRLAITCDSTNLRSKNIPERLGFILEGIQKYNRILPNTTQVSDTLLYARYDLSDLPKLAVTW